MSGTRRAIATSTLVMLLALSGTAAGGGEESSIVEASIAELQALMEKGEMSAEAITRAYLERIDRLDGELNAVIATNPDAVAQARALDEERRENRVRGPLHGIPILLKDNIESRDPMPTTAGSLALAGNVTGRDAFFVARLREAGVVILGKTNLSEWANFRSERILQRLERSRRPDEQPLRSDPQPLRLELGIRGRRRGQPRRGRDRHRDQRLDRLSRHRQRRGRNQADRRPGQQERSGADLPHPGHRRADGEERGRCGHPAVGHDRSG